MKYERRIFTFLKFSDSQFSQPGLYSRPRREIVNFARLAAVSSGEYRSFKTSLLASYNDDPSRLQCDELQS